MSDPTQIIAAATREAACESCRAEILMVEDEAREWSPMCEAEISMVDREITLIERRCRRYHETQGRGAE